MPGLTATSASATTSCSSIPTRECTSDCLLDADSEMEQSCEFFPQTASKTSSTVLTDILSPLWASCSSPPASCKSCTPTSKMASPSSPISSTPRSEYTVANGDARSFRRAQRNPPLESRHPSRSAYVDKPRQLREILVRKSHVSRRTSTCRLRLQCAWLHHPTCCVGGPWLQGRGQSNSIRRVGEMGRSKY